MTLPEIREVGTEAIDPVMAIMANSFEAEFGEAWSQAQCVGIMSVPGVWLALATVEGRPAGFALARAILDEAELLLIAVPPEERGRGLGTCLIDFTLAAAARRGATMIHLEVRDGNPAMRLYERSGFHLIGRRNAYYRGKSGRVYDALTLSRAISEMKNSQ